MTQEKIKTERNNLQFRVTKEFKTEYIADAKEAGMTATDYFKWLAKKEKPRTIKATPYQEAMFSLLAEFKCVASNVNQIAKVMNTEKKDFLYCNGQGRFDRANFGDRSNRFFRYHQTD